MDVHSDRIENFAFTNCKTFIFTHGAPTDGKEALKTRNLECRVCGIVLTGATSLGDHVKGKKHRRRADIEARWDADVAARGLCRDGSEGAQNVQNGPGDSGSS